MMNGANEAGSYILKSIAFPKFKLDVSYIREKTIQTGHVFWRLGINWDVNTDDTQWDELKIFNQLDLYRKKDDFHIARLHSVSTYKVSKGISFGAKYSMLLNLCNQAAAQLLGAWHVKMRNSSVATYLPQAFNKALQIETDFKQMIYEKWE
jgi:hypothetical protein